MSKTPKTAAQSAPAAKVTSNKALREKHGATMAPIAADRVFSKELPHFTANGIDANALILIQGDSSIGMNVYNGKTGKGYDPSKYTQPISEGKEKEWKKRGYVELTKEQVNASHFAGNVTLR